MPQDFFIEIAASVPRVDYLARERIACARAIAQKADILTLIDDPDDVLAEIAFTRRIADGTADIRVVTQLNGDMAHDKNKMNFRGCSSAEFLQCVLSDIALNAQRANTFQKSFSDVAGTIDMQRVSISGVDEDEEAVNLVKYQNAYNLSSKMIQVLTEIYDRLILETGV